MKVCRGSALVVVLCITAVLSMLMMRIYLRSSLILQTVVEREQCIKRSYAADALLLYGIHMAKHNWPFLLETTKTKGSEHHFMWDVCPKKVPATCRYSFVDKDTLAVEAVLSCDDAACYKRSCRLRCTKESYVIDSWREK
jgi:hypothetical protein